MKYETHFCTSADGTRIAYAVAPGQVPAVVMVPGWPGTIELVASDIAPHPLLGSYATVWFDRRGLGISERKVDDISLERQVEDLAAVVDDYTIDPIYIYSSWDGTPIALAYAALHPEKVSRMAMGGPYACGEDIISREALQSTVEMARTNWSLTRRSLAAIAQVGPPDQATYMELLRRSIPPEMAAAYIEQYGTMDATQYLDRVQVPTLVLHRPDDGAVPRAATEFVASRLANCRFVAAANREEYTEAIRSFLGDALAANHPALAAPSAFRTILFTDLVGHTEMMSRLGDERGRDVLREHERITREVLKANGGTEVKTMGDGFMASFGSVTRAVECAVALQKAFDSWNTGVDRDVPPERLYVRVGLNAGEPIEEDGDLFGATVILASRIAAKAEGGEILVADTVRGLCSGKGFLFADRGEFVAKGFEEPVRVYEVSWRE